MNFHRLFSALFAWVMTKQFCHWYFIQCNESLIPLSPLITSRFVSSLTNGVILYSNSLLTHFSLTLSSFIRFFLKRETTAFVHTSFLLGNLSVCTGMHVWWLSTAAGRCIRSTARWVSIDSLCMHNQTGDSQTSTPPSSLVSWGRLGWMFYLFWSKLIDWGGLRSVQSDLFFFVVVVVQIWNRSSYVCPRVWGHPVLSFLHCVHWDWLIARLVCFFLPLLLLLLFFNYMYFKF